MEEFCLKQLPLQKSASDIFVTETAAKYTIKIQKLREL